MGGRYLRVPASLTPRTRPLELPPRTTTVRPTGTWYASTCAVLLRGHGTVVASGSAFHFGVWIT